MSEVKWGQGCVTQPERESFVPFLLVFFIDLERLSVKNLSIYVRFVLAL